MNMLIILLVLNLLRLSYQRSTPQDDFYVAAVLEYHPEKTSKQNLENYVKFIHDASSQNADIVVFPEMTLTRGESVKIPIHSTLIDFPVPALNPNLYHEFLVKLSHAAREAEVYVVVNLQEEMDCRYATEEYCPTKNTYIFNSNVVFDRKGSIIDRYRKINLFGEYSRNPALKPELGIFETDFGVKFGHFICFDLLFQVPTIQLPQRENITNIVYSTMWFSELPLLTATSIQQAYAISNNVNFLASGANNIRFGSAGSGIYSGKSGALVGTMPGLPTRRMLVAKVPKVPGTAPLGSYPGMIPNSPNQMGNLRFSRDASLATHVSRFITPGATEEFEIQDGSVTCKFTVRVAAGNHQDEVRYVALARDGATTFAKRVAGIASCALVACGAEDIASCPYRFTTSDHHIEHLEIVMESYKPVLNKTMQCKNINYFPLSLRSDCLPLDPDSVQYRLEVSVDKETVQNSIKLLQTRNDLVALAIWGRIYDRDIDGRTNIDEVTRLELQNSENNFLFDAGLIDKAD